MNKEIVTFLHTGEAHVKTFSTLIEKNKLNITAKHIVRSSILEDAITNGITPVLEKEIQQIFLEHSENSKLMVCTCSTIGEIAERIKLKNGTQVIRIDRAMADLAVKSANKILVLAALESTLKPTASLMSSSQKNLNMSNEIDYYVVQDCWKYFLNDQHAAYLQTIAEAIELKQAEYDCIVLAQASMAGASELVENKRALILSSPEIGIKVLAKNLASKLRKFYKAD